MYKVMIMFIVVFIGTFLVSHFTGEFDLKYTLAFASIWTAFCLFGVIIEKLDSIQEMLMTICHKADEEEEEEEEEEEY